MKVLVKKMSKLRLLKFELIGGSILMLAAMIAMPVGILSLDPTLLENSYVLGTVLVSMGLFALVGFFLFIRPYLVYRKVPLVQAEADEEFLYIHGKKEAKIPLASLSEATARVELPYLYQKEFLREFIIHMFSEEYGDVVLEIPGYGTYKMRFVSYANVAANDFIRFIDEEMNKKN